MSGIRITSAPDSRRECGEFFSLMRSPRNNDAQTLKSTHLLALAQDLIRTSAQKIRSLSLGLILQDGGAVQSARARKQRVPSGESTTAITLRVPPIASANAPTGN